MTQEILFFLHLLAAISCCFGAYQAWRRKSTPANRPAFYLALSAAGWAFFYGVELLSTELQTKIFFSNIKHIFIVTLPVSFTILLIRFAGWSKWPDTRGLIALSLIPFLTIIAVFTNPLHHWYWNSITIAKYGGYTTLNAVSGPWYVFFSLYTYIFLVVSTSIAASKVNLYRQSYKEQMLILVICLLLPVSVNILYFINPNMLIPGVNLTPIMIGASILLLATRFRFESVFDVVSLAHTAIISQLRDGLIVVDGINRIIEVNRVMEAIMGFTRQELVGRQAAEIDHQITRFFGGSGTATLLREIHVNHDGAPHWYEVRVSNIYSTDNKIVGRMAIFHEITDRKRMEHDLRYESTHDALTGLFNRKYFEDEIAHIARGSHWPVVVMYVDMDNLKVTNDTYGHDAGDELLKRLADKLRITLRQDDVVARIGGDEFGVLVTRFKDENNIEQLIERMRSQLTRPVGIHRLQLEFSIGYAVAHNSLQLEEARILADQRMYKDKQNRKRRGEKSG